MPRREIWNVVDWKLVLGAIAIGTMTLGNLAASGRRTSSG